MKFFLNQTYKKVLKKNREGGRRKEIERVREKNKEKIVKCDERESERKSSWKVFGVTFLN